jgi:hypothetical protein
VEGDIEYLQGLESAALMQMSSGSRPATASAGRLANNLDAQRALAEIAGSSAPLPGQRRDRAST